jgi:hypothetical protein
MEANTMQHSDDTTCIPLYETVCAMANVNPAQGPKRVPPRRGKSGKGAPRGAKFFGVCPSLSPIVAPAFSSRGPLKQGARDTGHQTCSLFSREGSNPSLP